MKSVTNIKYLFMGKAEELKEIGELNIQAQHEWAKDSRTIFQNYCSSGIESKVDQRNKVKVKDSGHFYYFFISENYYFYIAVVDENYPESQVFKLFEEIYKDNIPLLRDDKGKLNKIGNQKLQEVVSSFQNPKNQIHAINDDLNEIKIEMKKNIGKVMENMDDASGLKNQSDKIAAASNDFHKQATNVRKQTCLQNFKLWIIIGVAVLVLIAIIVIIAVPKGGGESTGNNNSNNDAAVKTVEPSSNGLLRFL